MPSLENMALPRRFWWEFPSLDRKSAWEVEGITKAGWLKRQQLEQARINRERVARTSGGYPTGSGSSAHTVSGGLPGLGRKR